MQATPHLEPAQRELAARCGRIARILRALVIVALLPCSARAERAALTTHAQEVRAGERLQVELETAYGLTPPPGIQNERALRGFAARLCEQARCVPLEPVNVRPRDSLSFVYRVEFLLPAKLAPGRYDLEVRFPGGVERRPGGVVVPAGGVLAREGVAERPPVRTQSCMVAPPSPPAALLGLLWLPLSRKLRAARRGRSRCGHGAC